MATPQIPGGQCPHCQAPVIDLFAEWTDEYQSAQGKQAILAGDIVFDCYFCEGPIQLTLPLALVPPQKASDQYRLAKRKQSRCRAWLQLQHPGQSLSQIIEAANWQYGAEWAFDGYNWAEGTIHRHGQDSPPGFQGALP
jgi:hypothetical protein